MKILLDDCTAIEIRLAARRERVNVQDWVYAAIDRALAERRDRVSDSKSDVIKLEGRRT